MKYLWLSNSLEPKSLFGGTFVSLYMVKAFGKLGVNIDLAAWKDMCGRYDLLKPYDAVITLDYAVNPTLLKRISGVKKCVFIAIDDPELLHGPKHGWNILFTHSKGSVKLHEELGRSNVHYLPLASDPETFFPINRSEEEKFLDVVYVGNGIASKSYDIIMEPASNFDLNIWGKDWNKSSNHQFRRFLKGNIPPNKVNDVYNRSKIVLNMHRSSQRETQDSFIMRDYESKMCLLGGTYVQGPISKPIKNIDVGEDVLGSDGKFHKVVKKFKRRYTGPIIKITPYLINYGVSMTPKHPVLAVKALHCNRYRHNVCKPGCRINPCLIKKYYFYYPSWYPVEDLEEGDFLLFPVLNTSTNPEHSKKRLDVRYLTENSTICDGMVYPKMENRRKPQGNSKGIPRFIKISKEIMELFGYYVSEGHSSMGRSVIFSFGIHEEDYALRVSYLIKKIFGLTAKINRYPKKSVIVIVVSSSIIARMFANMFGKNAINKKLPRWIFKAFDEHIISLIEGMWRGDGMLNKTGSDKTNLGYYTASPVLHRQLILLLSRFGIASHASTDYNPNNGLKHIKNRAPMNKIYIQSESAIRFSALIYTAKEIKKLNASPQSYFRKTWWFDGRYIYLPIRKIEHKKFKGYVYNLEVEDTNDYVSEGFIVHNCGAFTLSDSFKGDDYFKDGMVTSDSPKDTKELIEYYLDPTNLEERNKIAQKGYDIVTKNKDTYEERAKKIIEIVGL
ncbi:hypothetical protein LCGC14_0787110 [marine sediment metagenome]|uniref:DOD-type homing endonuclease domain-containing protein n=1 Tax=marine sediment metagenome TaxID=412755 RepID=A0A0F9SDK4_9ZZZZ